jgi:hypothetical protein
MRSLASLAALALALAFLSGTTWAQEPARDDLATASPRVRAIVAADAKGGVPGRLSAIRALRGKRLSDGEIAALWAFVGGRPEAAGVPMSSFNQLRNDVLTVFVQHVPRIPDVVPRLCAMYGDETMDRTWRDYCIQFLGQCDLSASAADRRQAGDLLLAVAKLHGSPTAGTALIALSANVGSDLIDVERLGSLAVELAADPKASPGARMTAFQICVRHGVRDVLPYARQAAEGRSAKSGVARVSAIAAVGAFGDESDLELLTRLGREGDARLRRPASAARRRIEGTSRGRDAGSTAD